MSGRENFSFQRLGDLGSGFGLGLGLLGWGGRGAP